MPEGLYSVWQRSWSAFGLSELFLDERDQLGGCELQGGYAGVPVWFVSAPWL